MTWDEAKLNSDKLEDLNEEETEYLYQHFFKTPEQAYLDAIKYTLTKLI